MSAEQRMDRLATMFDATLPFRIADYHQKGGPADYDLDRTRAFGPVLAEVGDVFQFGGTPSSGLKETPASLFAQLADGLAVMSFCPGGVPFLSRLWDAYSGFPYHLCPRCYARHAGDCEVKT